MSARLAQRARCATTNHAAHNLSSYTKVYSVSYDSGWVFLEHRLLSRNQSQSLSLSRMTGATFEKCAEEIVRIWNTPGMFGDGDSLAEVLHPTSLRIFSDTHTVFPVWGKRFPDTHTVLNP